MQPHEMSAVIDSESYLNQSRRLCICEYSMEIRHDGTQVQGPLLRLRSLLTDYDFEFAELLTGLAAFGWGLWLLNPAWETFASSRTFTAMASLAPEAIWGLALFLLGALQLFGLLYDLWPVRRAASFNLLLAWTFIATLMSIANISSTASVSTPLFALSSLWAYVRMRLRG